jgi:toxin FitB
VRTAPVALPRLSSAPRFAQKESRTGFEDRVLPVTLQVAAAWGRQQLAQPRPVIDALIAATAQVHDLIVVTRNVKDFELAGVRVLNPFRD